MVKLLEIFSMHEQREQFYEPRRLEKGAWIEIINFEPETEQVEIFKRWEVENIERLEEKTEILYTITCKKLDIASDDKIKREIAQKILDKHALKIKASFAKCLVEGIDIRPVRQLKNVLYKMGGEQK
jgi:hypothetical protein